MFSKKIHKYTGETYMSLFDALYDVLVKWIMSIPEITPYEEVDGLKPYFIEFLLSPKEENNEYNEYFVLEYSDEIVDLFIKLKQICASYGVQFLHEKGRTSDDLLQFILKQSHIHVKYSETELIEDDFYDEYG